MTLRTIRITNVKGIQAKTFALNIIPNKPSILYAPNGFGKSSLAVAFGSLTNIRISLHKDNLYNGVNTNLPELEVIIERADGSVGTLTATNGANTISREIDCFTITSQVKAKGTKLKFGGRTNYSASLGINSIVLLDSIPPRQLMNYSVGINRQQFGVNGKILPNLSNAFNNIALIKILSESYPLLDRIGGVRIQRQLTDFRNRINAQQGSSEQLLDWMEANELGGLDTIQPLENLANYIMPLDLGFTRRSERVLAVLQMYVQYSQNRALFKAWCDRKIYEYEKESYISSFSAFNATWKDIRPKEKGGKLVVDFPEANQISNGQRDILCLVGLLEQAKRKLQKNNSILIIDEVFDYLDDANLIAAQYYITEFIENFKKSGRRIYPLILTHLNPGLFKNYAFSKMKVYSLDQRAAAVSQAFSRLLQCREHPTVQNDVSQFLLHYHPGPGQINKRAEFRALGLRETWGDGNNFQTYVDGQIQMYINGLPGYDPFAVCCAVRKRVEELTYNQIVGAPERTNFINEHMTNNKLIYAEQLGVAIPEYYYLLGIVYNDGMHWRQDRDNFSPLAAKLENGTIRKLISDLFA
jgi:hypothetical protein